MAGWCADDIGSWDGVGWDCLISKKERKKKKRDVIDVGFPRAFE